MFSNLSIEDYGPVFIHKGKYQGQVGLYDNDEGSKAIVYLYSGEYVEINPDYLTSFTFDDELANDLFFKETMGKGLEKSYKNCSHTPKGYKDSYGAEINQDKAPPKFCK